MRLFCVGELDMDHYQYYNTTPRELAERVMGWNRRHARYMEGVRIIAHTIAQVNSTKPIPPPEKWMPLPTDEGFGKKKGAPTEQEIAAAKAAIELAKKRQKLQPYKIVD